MMGVGSWGVKRPGERTARGGSPPPARSPCRCPTPLPTHTPALRAQRGHLAPQGVRTSAGMPAPGAPVRGSQDILGRLNSASWAGSGGLRPNQRLRQHLGCMTTHQEKSVTWGSLGKANTMWLRSQEMPEQAFKFIKLPPAHREEKTRTGRPLHPAHRRDTGTGTRGSCETSWASFPHLCHGPETSHPCAKGASPESSQ